MPKAQKKTRSPKSRTTPLASRNANATKQPPGSKKTSKSKKALENDEARVTSPQPSTATKTNHGTSSPGSESANNYLILATLSGSANPTIDRLLSLPPSLTFDKVHQVLQIAFGWTNSHMHDFNVSLIDDDADGSGSMGGATCLNICPNPDSMPDDLMEQSKAETEVTLAEVYEKPEWKDKAQIEYEYDHGDSWGHQLSLLGRATPGTNAQFGAPSDVKIICLSGQGHPAAEDVGGVWGLEDLKDAFKHPRKAENRERIEWYKNGCLNGGKSFDPYDFDVMDVNDGLRDAFTENQVGGKSHDECAGCGKEL